MQNPALFFYPSLCNPGWTVRKFLSLNQACFELGTFCSAVECTNRQTTAPSLQNNNVFNDAYYVISYKFFFQKIFAMINFWKVHTIIHAFLQSSITIIRIYRKYITVNHFSRRQQKFPTGLCLTRGNHSCPLTTCMSSSCLLLCSNLSQ